MSGQRSGAEAAFQCGQRNSLKTINVDGEHFIQFRGKSCVFKFIRLGVDVALVYFLIQIDSQRNVWGTNILHDPKPSISRPGDAFYTILFENNNFILHKF